MFFKLENKNIRRSHNKF